MRQKSLGGGFDADPSRPIWEESKFIVVVCCCRRRNKENVCMLSEQSLRENLRHDLTFLVESASGFAILLEWSAFYVVDFLDLQWFPRAVFDGLRRIAECLETFPKLGGEKPEHWRSCIMELQAVSFVTSRDICAGHLKILTGMGMRTKAFFPASHEHAPASEIDCDTESAWECATDESIADAPEEVNYEVDFYDPMGDFHFNRLRPSAKNIIAACNQASRTLEEWMRLAGQRLGNRVGVLGSMEQMHRDLAATLKAVRKGLRHGTIALPPAYFKAIRAKRSRPLIESEDSSEEESNGTLSEATNP